ncbi:MAG TPA: sugar ABC transporter permease [Chthoniobacteraceae bacterium]|nr:sugar ABC transporter permease [Chthoniobacteraceae bacterium]
MIQPVQRRNLGIALLFLAPNLIGFLLFTLGPILISLGGSFTSWSLKPSVPLRFVGLQNYVDLLSDPNFYFYLYNTVYLLTGLPISIAGSLALAVLLSSRLNLQTSRAALILSLTAALGSLPVSGILMISGSGSTAFLVLALGVITSLGLYFNSIGYRTFYYLPHFTAGASTILLWMQLYNPSFGLINQSLLALCEFLGIPFSPPGWLTSTRSLLGFLPLPAHFNNGGFGVGAREAIMIMTIWASVGGNNMILYLAGISNIPPELYEAADIDGASGWQRFRHITFPQLAPTTFFIVVMGVISGLQGGFEQAKLMTEGGPAGTTTTLSYYIYTQGFELLDLGYGAAVSWVLFLLMMGITLLNWRYGNRHQNQ